MWNAVFSAVILAILRRHADRAAVLIGQAISTVAGWLIAEAPNFGRIRNGEQIVTTILCTVFFDYAAISAGEPVVALASVSLPGVVGAMLMARSRPVPAWVGVAGMGIAGLLGVTALGVLIPAGLVAVGIPLGSRMAFGVYFLSAVWLATATTFAVDGATALLKGHPAEFRDRDGVLVAGALIVGLVGAMAISGRPDLWARAAADVALRFSLLGAVVAVVAIVGHVAHRLLEGWLLPKMTEAAMVVEWVGQQTWFWVAVLTALLGVALDWVRPILRDRRRQA